jgi:hydrogenase expression/formation protein HypD
MKYVDEFRSAEHVQALARAIAAATTRPWTIMEVCGGQTHAIVRFGLDRLLPAEITLVHGPGCPVCVTPIELIDMALSLAGRPEVILCSFGDMLRVPGSSGDLLGARAAGGVVRIVYAPLDAVRIAVENPTRQVVFFAVGFETTAPATALAVRQAKLQGLANFCVLVAHVLVPPAMAAILEAPGSRVQGFLAAGHVCTVMGCGAYDDLAARYRVPIIVTGFEPCDILQGVLLCVRQLEAGRSQVENAYTRAVRTTGNPAAQGLVRQVFKPSERTWRGLGPIPLSGLAFQSEYAGFDALHRFVLQPAAVEPASECIAGLVLQGLKRPGDCPAFGARCTPERPLGAPMVSSEGACAAYYRYRGPVSSLP